MASHLSMTDTYDAFLFELVSVEENGMELSVLSALARAGLDPWVEAKRLAALPRQAAVAAITAILHLTTDPETARRLADLLPRSSAAQPVVSMKRVDREALFRRYGLFVIVAWLVIAVVAMMTFGPSTPSTPTPVTAGQSPPAR
jgi:hypothetical protein